MIEAFQIGVSLAVDTDEAHAALAGFGRQLSSLDQSIAQTHRRMSDMRAALSMPDDISGGGRLSEFSQPFTRRDSRSQAGPTDVEGIQSLVDLMTAHDANIGGGSSEGRGRLLPGPDLRPHSDAADVGDLRSFMDVMGAAPEAAFERVGGASPQLINAAVGSPTRDEDLPLRHDPEPVGEDVTAHAGSLAAFDLSSLLPRLGETLGGLGASGRSLQGNDWDAAVPSTVIMPAWQFGRYTAEAGAQSGAVTDQVVSPDVAAAVSPSASHGLPLALPAGFSQERLPGYPRTMDQVVADPIRRLAAPDQASAAAGQGLEAIFTDAFSRLGGSVAPGVASADAMGRARDHHSDLPPRDNTFAIGHAEAYGGWWHPAVASGARESPGEGKVTSAAVPAEAPALPFGLPLLPPVLRAPGEERQPIPPGFPWQGDGFIGMPSGGVETAVKREQGAPLPPVFAGMGNPSSHASEDPGGQEMGRQARSMDERGDSAGDRPIVVHTNVQIDGDVVARVVTHRMVATLNGPLAGSGGFDPRRSYTPVES